MTQSLLPQPQTAAGPNDEQVTSAGSSNRPGPQQPPSTQDQQASKEASVDEAGSALSKRPDPAKIAANLLLFDKFLARAEAEEARDRFIDKYGCALEEDS